MSAFRPDAVARAVALLRAGRLDAAVVAAMIRVQFSLTAFGADRVLDAARREIAEQKSPNAAGVTAEAKSATTKASS
jgi:hypothetical protein